MRRHLGQNPPAAVMILFLLGMVPAIGGSGWLLTTDAYWGDETMETLRGALVNVAPLAIGVHVCAACYQSWQHRGNPILSMITGKKRTNPPGHLPG